MKYNNIDALDARIEKIIKTTVKFYYTDWKNYDRLKYMKCKGSRRAEDKTLILIARKCGTYLLRQADIDAGAGARDIFEYYTQYEPAGSTFYKIDIDALTIKKIAI